MSEAFPTGVPAPADDLDHEGVCAPDWAASASGHWSCGLGIRGQAADAAAELDELGFGALWIPGGVGGDVLGDVGRLLSATRNTVIATGILNIWKHEAREVGQWWSALPAHLKERVLLGLGVSHGPLIGETYRKPLTVMGAYLAQLSARGPARDESVSRRAGAQDAGAVARSDRRGASLSRDART